VTIRIRPAAALLLFAVAAAAVVTWEAQAQAPYAGPLVDAHSHLPGPAVLDGLLQAMDRHRVSRVALLGVGGLQPRDLEWIEAAARKHPERVIPFAPVPRPTDAASVKALERLLATGRFRGVGEVHVNQPSRKISIPADHPVLQEIYALCARAELPIVLHAELDGPTTAALERALARHPKTMIVLGHAGATTPERLGRLLDAHPNLYADLSGMHYLRQPSIAEEHGPLKPGWKELLERAPERFLLGVDLWAPRLYEAATLDRLFTYHRRILGLLRADVAEQIAHKTAARLYRLP
jgi:predicted TIM-barrel fold metal-dependent hydrolase